MKTDIKVLSKNNILSGKVKNLIPEFYELSEVIENTDDGWHHESTFDHTLDVMSSLEKLLLNAKGNLRIILNQKVDKSTRRILLKIASIFHDIAKKETIVKDENGFTECPGHAEKGAQKTKPILERFDLSKKEKQFILDIIRGHMFFHILTTPEKSSDFQKNFAKIKNRYINNIYPELILLCCADTINGGIRKTRPKEYKYRMDFYKKEIKKLSRGL